MIKKHCMLAAMGLLALAPLQAAQSTGQAVQITTSFSILENIVHDLLGPQAQTVAVKTLVGLNQNSHTYQLRATDVQTMQTSNLMVFNGLGFESAALQRAAQNTKRATVMAGDGLHDLLHGHDEHGDDHDHAAETAAEHAEHAHEHEHEAHDHGDGGLDPHVWLDPLNMPAYTGNITKALMQQQPEKKAQYALSWQLYQLKLAHLHGENVRLLAPIPLAKRKVLTSHAAFAYMGRRYQIEFFAPIRGGHEAEASAKTLVDLIHQVKAEHIQAVFVENVNDTRLLEQLSRETGVSIQGKLYSDALSSDAPDYFQFYRHNIAALVKALQH